MRKIFLLALCVALPLFLFASDNLANINNIFEAMDAVATIRVATARDSLVLGTGFFISKEHLLTNASTVRNAEIVTVETRGIRYIAQVVAVHFDLDFAIIRIPDHYSFRYFSFSNLKHDLSQQRINNLAVDISNQRPDIIDSRGVVLPERVIDFPAVFQVEFNMLVINNGGPIIDENFHIVGLLIDSYTLREDIMEKHFLSRSAHLALRSEYLTRVASIYTDINVIRDDTPVVIPSPIYSAPQTRPSSSEDQSVLENQAIRPDFTERETYSPSNINNDRQGTNIPTVVRPQTPQDPGEIQRDPDQILRERIERERIEIERRQREQATTNPQTQDRQTREQNNTTLPPTITPPPPPTPPATQPAKPPTPPATQPATPPTPPTTRTVTPPTPPAVTTPPPPPPTTRPAVASPAPAPTPTAPAPAPTSPAPAPAQSAPAATRPAVAQPASPTPVAQPVSTPAQASPAQATTRAAVALPEEDD